MIKILGKIENFDDKKSYSNILSSIKLTKLIPVYGTQCSCQYGYNCDDSGFDRNKPLWYEEIDINDERTKILI